MNHLSSREAFESHCRRHARAATVAPDLVVARVFGDGIVAGDPDDYGLVPHLCLDGFWESWISLAILRAIKPGWACLDIGASYGYFTSLMGRAAGPTGSVIAVEPNPAIHSRYLPRTLALSGLDATGSVRPVAVADRRGAAMLSVPPHRSMNATVGSDPNGVNVQLTTVDAMLGGDPVDIVKIDAEGAETRTPWGSSGGSSPIVFGCERSTATASPGTSRRKRSRTPRTVGTGCSGWRGESAVRCRFGRPMGHCGRSRWPFSLAGPRKGFDNSYRLR